MKRIPSMTIWHFGANNFEVKMTEGTIGTSILEQFNKILNVLRKQAEEFSAFFEVSFYAGVWVKLFINCFIEMKGCLWYYVD